MGMFERLAFALMVVLGTVNMALAETKGWTLPPKEYVYPPADGAWIIPVVPDSFEISKIGGAEGSVEFADGAMTVRKTNDAGFIRILVKDVGKLPPVPSLRAVAEVSSFTEFPAETRGYIRIGPLSEGKVWRHYQADGETFGGGAMLDRVGNTPPGRPQQKVSYCLPASYGGKGIRVGIFVDGKPSVSVWRNLRVDDMKVVEREREETCRRLNRQDFSADRCPVEALYAALENEPQHVAKMVRRDGYATIEVDGEVIPPIFYLALGERPDGKCLRFGGKRMAEIGMPLLVTSVRLGCTTEPGPWTPDGFDVDLAVRRVESSMRTAPKALYVLSVSLDAPRGWCDGHPEDMWRNREGEIIYGNYCHVIGTAEKTNRYCWAWASYSSPRWRNEVKRNLSALIRELKRRRLDRRIVGVHLAGGHDGQFSTCVPDYSEVARKSFRESGEKDFSKFLKRKPMVIQEDFASHVRAEFGKDILVYRWCMYAFGPDFNGAHDFVEFEDSKAIDIVVPQPSYCHRLPGYEQSVKLPFSSFHAHNKLLVHEHDFRTYGGSVATDNLLKDVGVGRVRDADEWRVVNRKAAGAMLARRTGFWYYDMFAGWFEPQEIAADIKSVIDFAREYVRRKPTPWNPGVALVVDEAELLGLQRVDDVCGRRKSDLYQWMFNIAASGVPCDFWMKRDFTNAVAARYRLRLDYDSRTELLSAAEINARAVAAGAYVPLPAWKAQVDMNADFISVNTLVPGHYEFLLPRPARVKNVRSGRYEPLHGNRLPLDLAPGETCWFVLQD